MNHYHITISTQSRKPLFLNDNQYHSGLRALARVSAELNLFCFADDHVHLLISSAEETISRTAGIFQKVLGKTTSESLNPAHITPVESRIHAQRLLPYIITQPEHHNFKSHKALWRGSCFPDLVGARYISGMKLQVDKLLPRFHISQALQLAGIGVSSLKAADNVEIREAGLSRLKEASIDALAGDRPLEGRDTLTVTARAVISHIALEVGFRPLDIADVLDISRQSVYNLRKIEISKKAVVAVRKRLCLENLVI